MSAPSRTNVIPATTLRTVITITLLVLMTPVITARARGTTVADRMVTAVIAAAGIPVAAAIRDVVGMGIESTILKTIRTKDIYPLAASRIGIR